MLAATTKIGSKYLVHIKILKALRTELENLPEKEKLIFYFKSAIVFLRPFLELAIKKNYTKDKIFQIMDKVGWQSLKTLSRLMESFTLEKECSKKECSNKKKPHSKSATKEKSDLSHSTVKQNEHKPQEIINAVLAADETKSQRSEIPNSVALNLNATKNES